MVEYSEYFMEWIKLKGGVVTDELVEEYQNMTKLPQLNEDKE